FQHRSGQIDLIPRTCRRGDSARPEGEAQMPRLDPVAVTEDDRSLDAVLQLADVAGPRIDLQLFERGRRQMELLVQIARELLDEMARERRNVTRTFAQRRNAD